MLSNLQIFKPRLQLTSNEKLSIFYHNIFDYPLTTAELIKWLPGDQISESFNASKVLINYDKGIYFIAGRENLKYKKVLRARISERKMEIAKRASKYLSLIPTVKMVAVTGSLAMKNSTGESDIDLILISTTARLWLTRGLSYLLLKALAFDIRSPGSGTESDKLCLNMWMDEQDLLWVSNNRNLYTAHEICQIVPLINKDKTYEKFLVKNKWIKDFWPNAVKVTESQSHRVTESKRWFALAFFLSLGNFLTSMVEKLSYRVQYHYMKGKITREVITSTRALFHPQDWSRIVLQKLNLG